MLNNVAVEKLLLKRTDSEFLVCIAATNLTLDDLIILSKTFLHPDELRYLKSLKVPRAQYSYLLGRYAAKTAVGAYTNNAVFTDVRIYPGVFNQPILQLQNIGNIQLSIAHADEMGMAIVFPEAHPMGVDVEIISQEKSETINLVITENERSRLPLLSADTNIGLTILWTIKEALSKIMRTGLMTPFQLYEIAGVQYKDGIAIGDFTNFPQYKSLSWISGHHAWSIVLPKNSNVDFAAINRFRQTLNMTPSDEPLLNG